MPDLNNCHRYPAARRAHRAQSLVEFAIGATVLIIILFAGIYFGMGMYFGQMASDQISVINEHKFEMADTPGAFSQGAVQGMISSGGARGNIANTSLDPGSVKFVMDGQTDAVITGTKTYTAMGIPIKFTVSQGIQKNLLVANTAAGVAPYTAPYRQPPWEFSTPSGHHPLPYSPCGPPSTLGESHAQALASTLGDPGTYIDETKFSVSSPTDIKATFMLAMQDLDQCSNAGGDCQAQYDALLPKAGPKKYSQIGSNFVSEQYTFYNPPGAPGQMVTMNMDYDASTKKFTYGNGTSDYPDAKLVASDKVLPGQGFYSDPSGQYIKPPDNYVDSCKKQKQAQCALNKAVADAQAIASKYAEECQ